MVAPLLTSLMLWKQRSGSEHDPDTILEEGEKEEPEE